MRLRDRSNQLAILAWAQIDMNFWSEEEARDLGYTGDLILNRLAQTLSRNYQVRFGFTSDVVLDPTQCHCLRRFTR
jgi:hypothetical protein